MNYNLNWSEDTVQGSHFHVPGCIALSTYSQLRPSRLICQYFSKTFFLKNSIGHGVLAIELPGQSSYWSQLCPYNPHLIHFMCPSSEIYLVLDLSNFLSLFN